jgi:uncharacterized protein YkwD
MLEKMQSHETPAISRRFTLALLVLSLLAGVAFAQEQFDSTGAKQLVELINQERVHRGLPPLAVDERLNQAARRHTILLVKHRGLSHQFGGEPYLQVRIADENLRSDRLAENVALEMDVAGIHIALMNSPPHRANILSPNYNAVGVGLVLSGDRMYATEDFAHRLPDYSEPEADTVLQKAITNYVMSQRLAMPTRKPQAAIGQMACNMALIDALDTVTPKGIAGVRRVLAWTATDLERLPDGAKRSLSQPLSSGYSLGVCFAPSVSRPGGVYWIVMVAY